MDFSCAGKRASKTLLLISDSILQIMLELWPVPAIFALNLGRSSFSMWRLRSS